MAYPGGGPGCSNTPLSVHFINYSLQSVNDSTYDSLHDTAQLAPAPSEKTITGAASSRYALRDRVQGLYVIRTYNYTYETKVRMRNYITACRVLRLTNDIIPSHSIHRCLS